MLLLSFHSEMAFEETVTVVMSAASIQRAGDRSRGLNDPQWQLKTGLLGATRIVIVSEFALPERFEAPMVTVWSPTAVDRPIICPFASIERPVGSPVAVKAVGP